MPLAGVAAVESRRAYEGGVALYLVYGKTINKNFIEQHFRVTDAVTNETPNTLRWPRQMLSRRHSCHSCYNLLGSMFMAISA